MDRRNFLKRGTLGVSGTVAAGSLPEPTKAAMREPVVPPPSDMDEYVRRVDAGIARFGEVRIADSFPEFRGDPALLSDLGRKAMHTLYVTGMFGDLSVENQLYPAMQDRLWASQETMDEALQGMTDFLNSRTPEQLGGVRATLRDRPEILQRIIRTVDEQSALSGLSEPRRAQLRTMFTEAAWRLEAQPPRLLVDEYVSKVERVTASDIESEARQRWLAARVGEEVFWQAQDSLRQRRITRGLRAMGIGALLFAAGLVLVSASDGDIGDDGDVLLWLGLVPGITVGSIFFVVGFIILLVGAATPAEAT